MSRRQGNVNENQFCTMAEGLGYCAFPARGSRGPVDVVCFEAQDSLEKWLPPLAVQVGTRAKPIAATLHDLDTAPRPIGSRCIVARKLKQKNGRIRWSFHTPDGAYESLGAALGRT